MFLFSNGHQQAGPLPSCSIIYVQDKIYKRTNVMQLGSKYIFNCNIALHVSDAFCVHLQEHLEIVEAASGK